MVFYLLGIVFKIRLNESQTIWGIHSKAHPYGGSDGLVPAASNPVMADNEFLTLNQELVGSY